MSRLWFCLLIIGLASGCGTSAESPNTTPPETTTTTVAATTSTVTTTTTPSGPSIVASFDGETCIYEGPEQVSATEIISLSFTNQSDLKAGLSVSSPSSEVLEDVRPLIGSDFEKELLPPRQIAAEAQVEPGEMTEQNIILRPGTWVVVCHPAPIGVNVWLAGILEVGD